MEINSQRKSKTFHMWASALCIRLYNNPAPVIRSMQFHYCTVSNPGTGADDAIYACEWGFWVCWEVVCCWANKTWLLPYACCGLHFTDSAACVLSFYHSTPLHIGHQIGPIRVNRNRLMNQTGLVRVNSHRLTNQIGPIRVNRPRLTNQIGPIRVNRHRLTNQIGPIRLN